MAISNEMLAEIKRKAQAGIPLTHPTPEKQKLYEQYSQKGSTPTSGTASSGGGAPSTSGGGAQQPATSGSSYTPGGQAASGSSYTPTQAGGRASHLTAEQHAYFDRQFGGFDNYVRTQQARFTQALADGDMDLVQRLQEDAINRRYHLEGAVPSNGGILSATPAMAVYNPQTGQAESYYYKPNAPAQDNFQQAMEANALQIESIMSGMTAILQQFSRQSNEHLAAAGAQLEGMMKMIDELEARITQQITGQMNADDPQMRAAIGLIRDEVKRQRDALLEEMNARGIVQSGLYLEMVDRMNRNELTQVQQLVGSRFADLQNQLNAALMNLAGTRIQMLGAHNQSLNAMSAADRSTLANLGMQGLQLGLQDRGMRLEDQRFYAGLSQQEQLARMQDETQRYGIDSQAATSRYVSDNALAGSMYGSDRSYAASVYGTDIDASVRQYLGELNASIDQQRIDLDRDSFNAYQSQVQQERIYAEMAMAQEEWSRMQQDHSSGKLTKQDLRNMMASSGYDPTVKEWLRARIETLPTLRHDEMRDVSNSANPFASPTVPASSGYTPSSYVPGMGIVPGIMSIIPRIVPGIIGAYRTYGNR